MTNHSEVRGPPLFRKALVITTIRSHPIIIKTVVGVLMLLAAATLFVIDADDDRFGTLAVIACPFLAIGLTLIALAVIDWQMNRVRATIWHVADAVREGEAHPRLRSVGRR